MAGLFDTIIGGTLGAVGIPAHKLPIVGGLFSNPEANAHIRQLRETAQRYADYRPRAEAAQLEAMRRAAQSLGPYNQAVADITGYAPVLPDMSPLMGARPSPQPDPVRTPESGYSPGYRRG